LNGSRYPGSSIHVGASLALESELGLKEGLSLLSDGLELGRDEGPNEGASLLSD
jgi:hypothetical protein